MSTSTNDQESIARTLEHYIEGGRAGSSQRMKPAFHDSATIHGYLGADLIAGPIQGLYDWVDANPGASELQSYIASIDLGGTVATVRLELDNWGGHKFTDMFTLLKTDGEWKIVSKVFHLHG
jgi:hypothetical protein